MKFVSAVIILRVTHFEFPTPNNRGLTPSVLSPCRECGAKGLNPPRDRLFPSSYSLVVSKFGLIVSC